MQLALMPKPHRPDWGCGRHSAHTPLRLQSVKHPVAGVPEWTC
jgi:hypothetical protein